MLILLSSLMRDGVLWYKFTGVLEDHVAPSSGQTIAKIYPQNLVNFYQSYVLDRAATGTGTFTVVHNDMFYCSFK